MQVIDECSPLVIQDISSSLRPRTYTWSSSYGALNELLSKVTGKQLWLAAPVTAVHPDTEVTITVQASDAAGVSSNTASFAFVKKKSPVPQVC